MTHVVRVRPAVGMQQLVGVPYVVALGVCGKMEGAGIAWPHTIVDVTSKEVLSEVVSHAGYDVDQVIVPETRWVDLVIGGHTHTFVDDFLYVTNARGKQVPIITDGKWGLEMGQINVRRTLSCAR